MDISSVLIYKTNFFVSCSDEAEDLLWKIVCHVKNWQTYKHPLLPKIPQPWSKLKTGEDCLTCDDVSIRSELFAPDDDRLFWACEIKEKDKDSMKTGVAQRDWITEIGYEQTQAGSALFSCIVSYEDHAGFFGSYLDSPKPTVPGIVKKIISDPALQAYVGSDVLATGAIRLKVGDWPSFRDKIENKERQIPYIYISPQTDIDPEKAAEAVYGNAVVYYSTDPAFTKEVEYLAKGYLCYDGAIKLYRPEITEEDYHPLFSAEYIRQAKEEDENDDKIIGYLRRAFSQNAYYRDREKYLRIADVRLKRKADHFQRLKEQRDHSRQQIDQSEAKANQAEAKASQAENDYYEILTENERLNGDLEESKQENYRLKNEIDVLNAKNGDKNFGLRNVLRKMPKGVDGVISYFEEAFSDRLLFAPGVKERAKRECDDRLADKIWEILYSFATTLCDLYRRSGNAGNIWKQFNDAVSGITVKRGEGGMTRQDSKLMKQFHTDIEGEDVNTEAHTDFSNNNQKSIHIGYSEKQKKVVIGHCGDHLDIYSTRKRK